MLDMRDPADTLIMNLADVAPKPIGHYSLQREIGRGGMSVVYEAQDTRTGQEIALKLLTLPPSLTPEDVDHAVARFKREARTAARLSHPNIVHIHEIGVHQGQHFLAMEYLRGQTLRAHLSAGALTPGEALPILTQIAGALDAAHQAGIVHRDVKPANVMLLPGGTAKLLDFGIAQSSHETTITQVGAVIGSPSYMAPEQVKGEPGTAATDIWALGVLSYELLAGHVPFSGQTVGSVLYQIMHQSPAQTPDLPISAQKVLRRALNKHPAQRYQTAGALIQPLKASFPEQASRLPVLKPFAAYSLSVLRWLPGAALTLLFLVGFCGAALERHHAARVVRKEAAAPSPSPSPAQSFASPPVFPASPPHAAPVRSSDAAPAGPPTVQIAPPRHPVSSPSGLPHSRLFRSPTLQAKRADAPLRSITLAPAPVLPVRVRRPEAALAQAARALPVRVHHSVVTLQETALRHAPVQNIHIPVQNTDRHTALQASVQPAPVQAAPPSVPAQSTVQDSSLPSDRSGYDPEADARLRKLAWSQNGSAAGP